MSTTVKLLGFSTPSHWPIFDRSQRSSDVSVTPRWRKICQTRIPASSFEPADSSESTSDAANRPGGSSGSFAGCFLAGTDFRDRFAHSARSESSVLRSMVVKSLGDERPIASSTIDRKRAFSEAFRRSRSRASCQSLIFTFDRDGSVTREGLALSNDVLARSADRTDRPGDRLGPAFEIPDQVGDRQRL